MKPVDYAIMYDPVYLALGVPATLRLEGTDTDGSLYSLTVIDCTAGAVVKPQSFVSGRFSGAPHGAVDLATISPNVTCRARELETLGVCQDHLDGAVITFNGKTWRVAYHYPSPSPNGELDGEVIMIVQEVT